MCGASVLTSLASGPFRCLKKPDTDPNCVCWGLCLRGINGEPERVGQECIVGSDLLYLRTITIKGAKVCKHASPVGHSFNKQGLMHESAEILFINANTTALC